MCSTCSAQFSGTHPSLCKAHTVSWLSLTEDEHRGGGHLTPQGLDAQVVPGLTFLSAAKVQQWSRECRKVFPCLGLRSELRDSPAPVLTFLYENCCSFQSLHMLCQLFLVPILKEKSWLSVKLGRERSSEKHCCLNLPPSPFGQAFPMALKFSLKGTGEQSTHTKPLQFRSPIPSNSDPHLPTYPACQLCALQYLQAAEREGKSEINHFPCKVNTVQPMVLGAQKGRESVSTIPHYILCPLSPDHIQ